MPHNYDVEEISAAVARRQGKWEQTLEGLDRAQEFDPRNSSPPFEFGQTYAQLRRYAEADQAYARAAELSADPALSQIRRAQNTVALEGRSRSAARYTRSSRAVERRVSSEPLSIFRPGVVVAGLCDCSAYCRGI